MSEEAILLENRAIRRDVSMQDMCFTTTRQKQSLNEHWISMVLPGSVGCAPTPFLLDISANE